LIAPTFRFPALAVRAARAQVGGDREPLLAALVAARLIVGATSASLPLRVRSARATAARRWVARLTLPGPARAAFLRVAQATAGDDRAALAAASGALIDAVASALDPRARAELDALYSLLSTRSSL
jgi:hypothetical protein